MEIGSRVRFFKRESELREWFLKHHEQAEELWIGFYKKDAGKAGVTYQQALDQALCFGWIDGIRKSLDASSYASRFTPRKRGSKWSRINIAHAERLIAAGLMTPRGLEEFNKRDEAKSIEYSYEGRAHALSDAFEKAFRASTRAWAFFESQAPWYKRAASNWVMSAKREETRKRRLSRLIEDSENGRRIKELARPERK